MDFCRAGKRVILTGSLSLTEAAVSERSTSSVRITEVPAGTREIILTGDRPTGPLHLGHYWGSLRARVQYQERFPQYILIADMQALTDNAENPEKVSANVIEVMLDYLAVGLDPARSTIYVQSCIPETAELTLYFMNLLNVGRLMRNPTVKTEAKQKDFGDNMPVGFLCYPINQAADIAQFKATLVPVGEDQIPMIELTNDLARSFNRIYHHEVFSECRALVAGLGLLPGIDGNPKMSKSLGNAVYLKDTDAELKKKINLMYTDPKHLRVEDPGTVEGNVVFSYLDAFDPDRAGLEEMKAHYRRGGLGDGVVKQHLLKVLIELLTPIRNRRAEFARDPGEVWNMLRQGSERARAVVAETLSETRRAMGINYFEKLAR